MKRLLCSDPSVSALSKDEMKKHKRAEYMKLYRERNKEKIKDYMRTYMSEYREDNKEAVTKYAENYKLRHPEKVCLFSPIPTDC